MDLGNKSIAVTHLLLSSSAALLFACTPTGDRKPAVQRPAAQQAAAKAPSDELACVQVVFFQHNGGTDCADCVETLPADAERKAIEAQALLEHGADFTELAKTMASAKLGNDGDGVFGTFRRSQWPEVLLPIRDAVFALKIGEHAAEPLQVDYAYLLVRRCPTGTPTADGTADPSNGKR